eukprot:TRINITY_DN42321_c0_g1_i1.p1 TRINITY_DN42321_c0_g1~~TRINITY_DN42321_c0_g1_i1.p1  ORF type:complete len:155 (+),score=36.65 TRINITY_DN42321_c0_g1_i1:152-616(+)
MAMDYNEALITSFTLEEQFENFGGSERVEKLRELLRALQAAGVKLYVISTGFKYLFGPLMQAVGLLEFFRDEDVFGQVEQVARTGGCVKGQLIQQLKAECSWENSDVLFIDDSAANIEGAKDVCLTYHIPQPKEFGRHGMWDVHFERIRELAGI